MNQSSGGLDVKHKGARNELAATVWLMDQGYEVFRNLSPHGAIDIIAIKDGILFPHFYVSQAHEIV